MVHFGGKFSGRCERVAILRGFTAPLEGKYYASTTFGRMSDAAFPSVVIVVEFCRFGFGFGIDVVSFIK